MNKLQFYPYRNCYIDIITNKKQGIKANCGEKILIFPAKLLKKYGSLLQVQ